MNVLMSIIFVALLLFPEHICKSICNVMCRFFFIFLGLIVGLWWIVDAGAQQQQQQQLLLVATCHIHWDPDYSDVKLIQTMMLMNELKHIVDEVTSLSDAGTCSDSDDCRSYCDVPLILCGDFNSLPDSGWFLVLSGTNLQTLVTCKSVSEFVHSAQKKLSLGAAAVSDQVDACWVLIEMYATLSSSCLKHVPISGISGFLVYAQP